MAAIRLLARLTHWLWMLVATIVIGYAVLVVVGRMLLPSLDDYRPDLTRHVSELLEVDVEINSLSGAWPRLTPNLSADSVSLRARDTELPGIEIGKVSMELSPFQSLWQRELIWQRLKLADVKVHLQEDANGRWSIAGFPLGNGGGFRPIDMLLYSSLIEIDRVELSLGFYSGANMAFVSDNILIENSSDFHRIVASLNSLVGKNEKVASFVFEASGDPAVPDSFDGNGYLRLHQINFNRGLQAIAKRWLPVKLDDQEDLSAYVDAELWFDFEANGNASIVGRLKSEHIPLDWAAELPPVQNIKADLAGWYHPGSNWGITLQSLEFDWGQHQIDPLDIRFGQRVGARWGEFGLDFSHFDLEVARSFLLKTGLLNDKWQNIVSTLNPAGNADKVSVDFSSSEGVPPIVLRTSLTDVSIDPWRGAPGAKGLDGYLEMSKTDGLFVIQSAGLEMDYDSVFDEPIAHDTATGAVSWHWNQELNEVSVVSGPLKMNGEIGNFNGQFFLNVPLNSDKSSQLFLEVGANNTHSRYSHKFIPHFLDDELSQWLDSAVGDTKINQVGVIFRGALRQGLSDQRTFQMFLDVEEGNLKVHPEWPALSNLNGSLVVSDEGLTATIRSSQFGPLAVSNVEVSTRKAGKQENNTLFINTSKVANASSIYQFLLESPLREQVNELEAWQLSGDIHADVNLAIPLTSHWQAGNYSVDAKISNGAMIQPEFGLELNDIHGRLNYTSQKGVVIKDISAKLWGSPVTGFMESTGDDIRITIDGELNPHKLLARYQWRGRNLVSGAMASNAVIILPNRKSGQPMRLEFRSDMVGVAVKLPKPFNKAAEESKSLTMALEFGDTVVLTSQYGDQISMGMEASGGEFVRGYLGLNQFGLSLPEENILHLVANIEHIDLAVWESELLQSLESSEGSSAEMNMPPVRFEANLNELALSDLKLTDASFKGDLKEGILYAELASKQAKGSISVPVESEQPISVSLDHLKIPKPETKGAQTEEAKTFDPRSLRPMTFSVTKLLMDEKNIGNASFTLNAGDVGLHIRKLDANIFGLQIGGEAHPTEAAWLYDGETHRTELKGVLQSKDLGSVLQNIGFGKVIQSKNTLIQTDVSWAGRPWQLSVDNLQGQMTVALENGTFYAEPGKPANAFMRVIGLFNFETWLRRLKLDFSDLYEKGVSYDSITGSLVFNDGRILFPEPVVAATPSGKMQMQGNIDMINELIDVRFVATLPVGTNLPWMAALAINLPAAAGVWLVSKVFKKQVDNFSSISYKIEGPWDDPDVKLERVFSDQNQVEEKKKAEKEARGQAEKERQVNEQPTDQQQTDQ